jgi:hypothetical protein
MTSLGQIEKSNIPLEIDHESGTVTANGQPNARSALREAVIITAIVSTQLVQVCQNSQLPMSKNELTDLRR